MSSFNQLCRLSNYVIGGYKTVIHGRLNWLTPIQTYSYTRKSAEERLGIEKPKRPLTPFFKFMNQMRPALLAKNPGITSKEAVAWSSKHWQELDAQTKNKMMKEFEKDMEDYKKIKAMYEASLTEQQKEDIKRVKNEMDTAKEKRKMKAEYKEMGRPKKPMSSYFLYMQSRKDLFQGKHMKESQEKIRKEWFQLASNEKAKFEKQAQDLMAKFRKDLEAWELKMISQDRLDLVQAKTIREKKPKASKKTQ